MGLNVAGNQSISAKQIIEINKINKATKREMRKQQQKPNASDLAAALFTKPERMIKVRKRKARYSVYAEFISQNIEIVQDSKKNAHVRLNSENITIKIGFDGYKKLIKLLVDYVILGGKRYDWVKNNLQKLLRDLDDLYREMSVKAFAEAEKYFTKEELDLIMIMSNFRGISFALGIQGVFNDIKKSSHQVVMDDLKKLFHRKNNQLEFLYSYINGKFKNELPDREIKAILMTIKSEFKDSSEERLVEKAFKVYYTT